MGPDQTGIDDGDLDAPLLGVVPEDDEAAGEEPLVKTAEGRPTAAAYRDLTTVLVRGLEAGEMPEDIDSACEASWFEDGEESDGVDADGAVDDESDGAGTDGAEDDETGGGFSIFG